jgi:Coenzyme PQQ synthesis protein D (PqqD)
MNERTRLMGGMALNNRMQEPERPKARSDGLVVEQLDDETLVYDTDRHQAHCLNGPSAIVWRACDGTRSEAELAAVLAQSHPGLDGDATAYALQQLAERRLLEPPAEPQAPRGVTRRELVRKAAIGGLALGLSVPVIKSIVAPTPAHAFSCVPTGGGCSSSAQCCSGVCFAGHCI